MASKIKAKGVVIKYGSSATPTTTFPQLSEVGFDAGQWDRTETTTHDTSGSTKTYEPTLKEPCSLEITAFFDPEDTAHAAIQAAHAAGTNPYYHTLVLPNAGASQYEAVGQVTNLSLGGMTPGGLLIVNYTFSGTGAHTFTA